MINVKEYIISVAKDEKGNTSYIVLNADTHELILQTTRYDEVARCVI